MAFSFVQQAEVSNPVAQVTLVTPSINTTAGNLLCVVTVCHKTYIATNAVASSQTDVFTNVVTANNAGAGNNYALNLKYAVAKGGATTFTQSNSGGTACYAIAVFEYNSAGATWALLGSSSVVSLSGTGLGANNLATPTLGATIFPALAFGFSFDNNKTEACTAGTSPTAFTSRAVVWGTFAAAGTPGTGGGRAEDAQLAADSIVTFGTTSANRFDEFNAVGAAFSLAVPISPLKIPLDDPAHAGASDQLLIGSALDDHTGEFLRNGGVKLKQWAADVNTMMDSLFDLTYEVGDAAYTLTLPTVYRNLHVGVALTANRIIALPTTGLLDGMKFRVVRDAATPGAFTLTITGARANIVIASGVNGFAAFRATGPTTLVCEGTGTLP